MHVVLHYFVFAGGEGGGVDGTWSHMAKGMQTLSAAAAVLKFIVQENGRAFTLVGTQIRATQTKTSSISSAVCSALWVLGENGGKF